MRRSGRICRADLNGDNLRIYTAYLRISEHCRITVRVRAGVRVRVMNMVRVSIRVSVRVGVADCCIQCAGKVTKCGLIT